MAARAAAAALIAFLSLPAVADEPTAPPLPANPVVRLGDIMDRWFCSGFYVGDNTIVTAGHCVTGADVAPVYHVRLENGVIMEAFLGVMSDVKTGFDDYAILRLHAPADWKPAELDCSGKPLPIGTQVRGEGYPGDIDDYTVVTGRIMSPSHPVDPWRFPVLLAQIPVSPGHSGGPLYREADNLVEGILVALSARQPAFTIVQPIGPICATLHRT